MPAVMYTYNGGDLFKLQSGSAHGILSVPALDAIVENTDALAIYDSVQVQLNDTLQYFLTFDDVIKYIFFGKGLGNISVSGTLFVDRSSNMPGLEKYFHAFGGMRGKTTTITLGGQAFTCVVAACNILIVADPDTTGQFQMVFSVVNHKL